MAGALDGLLDHSLTLIAFGIAGMMTIGRPFLLIGAVMLVLGPLRHRALAFWPLLLGCVAYNIAYLAIEPFYCSATSSAGGGSPTTCSSLVGVGWPAVPSGLADAAAALDITNRVALVVGVATFALVLGWLSWHREARVAGS